MKKRQFDLQLFADGGDGGDGGSGAAGAGAGAGNGGPGGNPGGGTGGSPEGGAVSFDDFLKDAANQAEFDRRVQKSVQAAVDSAQKKWKAITDENLSEAEKLAQMTKEEKAEYLRQKERREFEQEKAEFEREKLLVEVKKGLQEQSLPSEFADSLVNIADAEKIKDAISGIKKVWDAGITEAVKKKARQDTPPDGGHIPGSMGKMQGIREMARKNRIIKN